MAITNSTSVPIRPAQTLVLADRAGPVSTAAAENLQAPVGVALVPTEAVLLLAVDLPEMPAAQRRAAVGFSVEEWIAQSLEDVQVVLGPQTASGKWLVAVTARAVLADGDAADALWPDAFLIPVPRAGWSVWCGAGRAVVRVPDGTGFATSLSTLPSFFAAAGSPAITLFGGVLPPDLAWAEQASLPSAPDPILAGFDLRASLRRAHGHLSRLKGARPLCAVLLVSALSHLVLSGLDVIVLSRMAAQRAVELRAVLSAPEGIDLDVALAQALAARQPVENDGVLPLLSRAFAAIGAQAGRISVQDLQYVAADRAAVLTLEAPDLVSLQAAETALTAASLSVTAGAATTSDGGAEVVMTIREGGA